MKKLQTFFKLTCSVMLIASIGYAQASGGIRGVVYDKDFDAPLGLAEVTVAETGQTVQATEEGNYAISGLEPGTYTLVVSKDGYTRKVFADVVVPAGSMNDQDAYLAGEFTDMEEFVVQDLNMGGASEEGLLNLRMEAPALMDSVGADLMSKAGASDAAGALKLVSGATVQDGKYAVVRGLPDRYVNSQMNGVRLPTADPDKRAVQLDQFPSAAIESIQVSKTFTPDQQGDASGGAVNVVLKGIPEDPVLKLKLGTKYKTGTHGEEFLTYKDAGLGALGLEADQHRTQPIGTVWDGAVGVEKGHVPDMYDWSLVLGGSKPLFPDWKVGGLANVYYKRDASSTDDGVDDKYYYSPSYGLIPKGLAGYNSVDGWYRDQNSDEATTSLFDVQKSSEKVQWGWLGAVGIENDRNKLKLLHMRTHIAEDKATLAEDTRGHDEYTEDIVYRRMQTLETVERDTETLQISGQHTVPFPELGLPGVWTLREPELDWTVAQSSSALNSPDKRTFASLWLEEQEGQMVYIPGLGWFGTPDVPAHYESDNFGESVENFERIWKKINEDSEQYFVNGKLPFEQWSGEEGFLKVGLFKDQVERSFTQKNYAPQFTSNTETWDGDWSEFWSDAYAVPLFVSPFGAGYDAEQEITAWYWMADVPLSAFFKVTGGARVEETHLGIEFEADSETRWYNRETGQATYLALDPPDNTGVDQKDVLPSIGFEFSPLQDLLVFRGNYSQTVARPTFKEMSPVAQQEYAGGDVFVGNPGLQMSSLKNYDLRADWTPYEGALISLSWFKKEIKDPIEYTQEYQDFFKNFTTAVNYPEGALSGYEFEVRQHLGQFVEALDGLSVGGNLTLIDSEVTMSDDDVGFYYQDPEVRNVERFGFVETSREMVNTPERLYNLFATYDLEKTGTKLGLFYTVQGDTLLAGADNRGNDYVPNVYATEFGTLNFSLSQKIGERWTLGFKAKNLLDPEIQQVYRSEHIDGGDVLKRSYSKGMEFSVSLGCEF